MHQAVAQAITHRLKLSYNKVDISYYISVIWASKKKKMPKVIQLISKRAGIINVLTIIKHI